LLSLTTGHCAIWVQLVLIGKNMIV
jgi:hypothetical protein